MAGTSAQKPPSSASCTTILIVIARYPISCSLRRLRVDLRRHLPDGASELLGGLGAGDGVFLREHEGRHAGDALVGGVFGLCRDQFDVLVGRQTSANVIRV